MNDREHVTIESDKPLDSPLPQELTHDFHIFVKEAMPRANPQHRWYFRVGMPASHTFHRSRAHVVVPSHPGLVKHATDAPVATLDNPLQKITSDGVNIVTNAMKVSRSNAMANLHNAYFRKIHFTKQPLIHIV